MKKKASGDTTYTNILLEDINGKFDVLVEAIVPMQEDIAVLKEDVAALKDDNIAIKAAIKDISHILRNHETRITRLETQAA